MPSGENTTVATPRSCPSSVAFTFRRGQVPERDRAGRIERTVGDGQGLAVGRVGDGPDGREVPLSVARAVCRRVARLQSLTVRSLPAVASERPSGEKTT